MIPAWMLKRAGEVELFLKLIGKTFQLRPSLEIYSTNRGGAIGINYKHQYFDNLGDELKIKMLSDSGFDEEDKKNFLLWQRWIHFSSWRKYKQDNKGTSFDSDLRTWYCDEVEENDIAQLREIYNWTDGVFTREEFEKLKKFSDKNQESKTDCDFEQCSKLIYELLHKPDISMWYYTVKGAVQLVADLCGAIDALRLKKIASTLKLPLRDIVDNKTIAETFIVINKLKNLTSKNIELVDAYDELSKLVENMRAPYGYKSPMRSAKENLNRIKRQLEIHDLLKHK